MAKIIDIAKKAKVSPSTVSRVLNYDATLSVTDKTKRKVFEAAEELNYQRRPLKKYTGQKIAVVHWYTEKQELNDLYYLSIRLGIEQRCKELNIEADVYFYDSIHDISASDIEGIIAVGKFGSQQVSELAKISPIVTFVDYTPSEEKFDSVVIDFENATKKVLDYFVQKNHNEIGFIGGREILKGETAPIEDIREKTYETYMQERDIYRSNFTYVGGFSVEEGYNLMKQAIENLGDDLPTAFFISSDVMAIGSMRALHEANIRIPDRVSLISINDISVSKHMYPPLSTVKVHTEVMGATAVDLLVERLEGRTIGKKVFMATDLIIRESV